MHKELLINNKEGQSTMNIKHQAGIVLKKITSVFSIITIILGTSFGAMNSANADDGDAVGVSAATGTVTSATTNIDQSDLTLQTDEDTATTFTINATTPFAVDILTTEDSQSIGSTITVTGGVLTVDEAIAMLEQTIASTYSLVVAASGGLTVTGNITEGALATLVTELQGSTLTLNGAGAQAIATAIDSDAGADGVMVLTGAGVKTFSDTIGSTNGLASITIGTTADDSAGNFNASVKATTINIQSGDATDGTEVSSASFAAAVTGNIVLKPNGDSALVNFDGESAITALTGTITTTSTDGDDSTVSIYDDGGGAPALQTFTGQIGTSTNKIGTLAIGANADAGNAKFNSDVFATTVNVIAINTTDESSTATFDGNLTATAIKLDDATELAKIVFAGSSKTIAGTIDGLGADGEGELEITGANTIISGNVGAITARSLRLIDIDAASNFSGTSEATAFTVDADTTFTGAVTANTSFTVATAGTDVILTAASNLGTATVTTGTLTANGLLTTVNTVNTAGKIYLNVKNNEMGTGKYTAGDGAELHVGKAFVTTDTIFLSDAAAGVADIHAGSKIYLPANLTSGETLKIVDAGLFDEDTTTTALTMATRIDLTLQDTALVNYSASAAGAEVDTITITATDRTVDEAASQLGVTKNTSTAAFQLMTAMDANDVSGDTAAYTAFDNALKAQGGFSATEDTSLLQQTSAQDDLISGSTFATKAMTGTVQGIVASRMASLRSGDAYVSGIATGNHMSANSMFLEAFGSMSEQDNKRVGSGTQFGYEADTAGLAIGADGLLSNGSVLGLSLSMSNTDVDGKGTGRARNDIDSYTASLYMDKATAAGYIEGSLTYGINENSSSRIINTAGLNRTYSADYDSDQISLKIGGGIPNNIGDNTFITPFGSLTATKISTDAYTERSTTAGDSLRLRVAQDDVDSFVGTIGIKAHKVTDQGTPMISLAINNEFGDSTINSTNTYQGGGTAFKTSTDVEELSATLALGYKFGSDKLSFTLGYEATANDDDYLSHYGSAKLVSKF